MKFLSSVLLCIRIGSVSNARVASVVTIPLDYGNNMFTPGPGETAVAVLAHRENFNAHSFDVLTLYLIPVTEDEDAAGARQFVPFFDGEQEELTLTASGGADCVPHDFRLIRTSNDRTLA